jgi:MFS family permease
LLGGHRGRFLLLFSLGRDDRPGHGLTRPDVESASKGARVHHLCGRTPTGSAAHVEKPSPDPAASADPQADERRALGAAASAHVVHDGYSDLLYVLLPVWQAEFGLGYAEVGLLRSSYTAAMASLQIPASLLAERISPLLVLVAGTVLAAACFLLAGASAGLTGLLCALVLGGIGASTQHPIGSAIVSAAFQGARSRTALGVYNFTGDLGKIALPALAAALLTFMAWRPALWVLAGVGLAAAFLVLVLAPASARIPTRSAAAAAPPATAAPIAPAPTGFRLLLSIGMIDNAARSGFLTFLPFLLQAKGASLAVVGLALSLTFAGGAAGKLVCGYLGARLGVLATVALTESLTAAGILALLALPLDAALLLLPVIGIGLNGTSSVLYGTVPELVAPEARTRAFGIFYTGAIGASAAAPPLFGLFSDAFGVPDAMTAIAIGVLATIPLTLLLNPLLPRSQTA